jgi:uncharacterized protein YdhG (YjbR/CyaY superfamily)
MKPKQATPKDIDEYIAAFPENVQDILQKIRTTIKTAALDAEEAISYGMPTFNLNGHYLIYFAAYKKHIGLYPVPRGSRRSTRRFLLIRAERAHCNSRWTSQSLTG